MTSTVSPGRPEGVFLGLVRAVALIALLVGAGGSVGLFLYAGRHRHPGITVMVLFVIWVLSPFMLLALTDLVSKRWSALTRAALYSVMLVLTLASWIIYGILAFGPPRAKMVAVFVMVPPASWVLIATVVPIAALISKRRSRRSGSA
jgi:hypothetical protein